MYCPTLVPKSSVLPSCVITIEVVFLLLTNFSYTRILLTTLFIYLHLNLLLNQIQKKNVKEIYKNHVLLTRVMS